MVEITETIEPVKEQTIDQATELKEPVKEMKLEDILNDLYQKIVVIQNTIGYILEESKLINKVDSLD